MAGGYKAPRDGMRAITGAMADQRERLRELERPTGTSIGSLVQQVQMAIANLVTQVNTVATAWMAANAYTKAQVDTKVANPGTIAPVDVNASGNVNVSGQVISTGVIRSPGTRANTVTLGYQSLWADSAGNFGANTSSRRYKQDITPVGTPGFLGLQTYKFRYIANVEALGDDAPWDYGLIAEEVVEVAPWACFFEEDGETVKGVNYDRLVIGLLNVAKDHESRIAELEAKA